MLGFFVKIHSKAKYQLCQDILAVVEVWWDIWNCKQDETIKCDKWTSDRRTDRHDINSRYPSVTEEHLCDISFITSWFAMLDKDAKKFRMAHQISIIYLVVSSYSTVFALKMCENCLFSLRNHSVSDDNIWLD